MAENDHQRASALASAFHRAVCKDPNVKLDKFLDEAPESMRPQVCGELIEIAFEVRCSNKEIPWIDDYLSASIWPHRREICRVLTRRLFEDDDGAMARQLGLLEFDDFTAVELRGFGGFGSLLKAVNKDRTVAIKIAHRNPPIAVQMLKKEADALERIGQLNLAGLPVGPFNAFKGKGWHGLAQGWVNGKPLDEWQSQNPPPGLEDRFEVGRQIASVVADLHHASYQHGDLSPANVLVLEEKGNFDVHLVDFANSSSGFSAERFPAITGAYAAPELLRNPKKLTSAPTDLFSLGVLLYELFVGKHPFGAFSQAPTAEALARHFEGDLQGTPPREIPDRLWEKLLLSMDRSPRARMSARAFLILGEIPTVGNRSLPRPAPMNAPSNGETQRSGPAMLPRERSTAKLLPRIMVAIACVSAALVIGGLLWPKSRRDQQIVQPQPVLPEEISHDFLGMKLRMIHPGSYFMGSPPSELAGDGTHHIDEWLGLTTLTRPIYMSELDVTRGMFKLFVKDADYVTEAERESGQYGASAPWLNPGILQNDGHPVVQVSWNDAVAFTSWLSVKTGKRHRLPLEAEWEYACRAGTDTPFSTGKELDPLYANFKPPPGVDAHPNGSGIGGTTTAGSLLPNAWGLYDMHGNVLQWCLDDFKTGTPPGPLGYPPDAPPTTEPKNLRGGCWSHPAIDARSANRWVFAAGYHQIDVGFRVVMEP